MTPMTPSELEQVFFDLECGRAPRDGGEQLRNHIADLEFRLEVAEAAVKLRQVERTEPMPLPAEFESFTAFAEPRNAGRVQVYPHFTD
jgi:hypothetical protein